jgi:hypothetical protein
LELLRNSNKGSNNNNSNGSPSSPTSSSSTPPTPPKMSPSTEAMVNDHAKGGISYMSDDETAARRQHREAEFEQMISQQPSSKSPPHIPKLPEIEALKPEKVNPHELEAKIATADLESIITPDGIHKIFMASWYNETDTRNYDITNYQYDSNSMLVEFWNELIFHNQGRTVYFHNWAGYDANLSLIPLVGLHEHGLTFEPIIQNNQVISLTVFQENTR